MFENIALAYNRGFPSFSPTMSIVNLRLIMKEKQEYLAALETDECIYRRSYTSIESPRHTNSNGI